MSDERHDFLASSNLLDDLSNKETKSNNSISKKDFFIIVLSGILMIPFVVIIDKVGPVALILFIILMFPALFLFWLSIQFFFKIFKHFFLQ